MNTELWQTFDMLPRGEGVLCAVSGGADSLCLLHLLWSRRAELGVRVCAAHYEHGLRGRESLDDCAFVEAFCRERDIPCLVGHGDAAAFAAREKLSLEDAARRLRYDFLERAADELGCGRIATAHTADDNAETMLLNLARGAGAKGLCGIPPRRGRIVRPLLGATRAEAEAYLSENGLTWREDSSNGEDVFRRNRLRHAVTPVLREINPAFAGAAARTAALLREDEDCLEGMAERFLGHAYDGRSLPADELAALHPAIASRALRALCPQSLEQKHVDAALRFARGGGLGFLDLPGLRLRREQGRLWLNGETAAPLPERVIRPGTVTELPEAGLRVRAAEGVFREKEINNSFKTYCLKCENIKGNLVCASRRPGDRIAPAGRGVTKSLKSLFLEAGLTQAERERTPVFRDDEGVLLVCGLAAAERSVPREGDRVLRLAIETIGE